MKMSERYRVKTGRIRSLRDLTLEKQRLRMEILKTEQDIHSSYRNILHTLSIRNLVSLLVGEITASHAGFSKAFSLGVSLFGAKKKKKHAKAPDSHDPEMR